MQYKKVTAIGAALLALATAAACSSSKSSDSSKKSQTAKLSGACAKYQAYAGYKGSTVTMFGSILSPESDSLNKSWAEFSSCTGITIKYTGKVSGDTIEGKSEAGERSRDWKAERSKS